MKNLFFTVLFLCGSISFSQSFRDLDKSPMDRAIYPSGMSASTKTAVITYSRPQLKGRSFEDIVPSGKIWRTGANESTELRLFKPINIDGKKLDAGTYTIFTIPNKDSITFIVNSVINVWGSYAYSEDNDVLRVDIPLNESNEQLEAFSIAFGEDNGVSKMYFGWDKIRFEVPFSSE